MSEIYQTVIIFATPIGNFLGIYTEMLNCLSLNEAKEVVTLQRNPVGQRNRASSKSPSRLAAKLCPFG